MNQSVHRKKRGISLSLTPKKKQAVRNAEDIFSERKPMIILGGRKPQSISEYKIRSSQQFFEIEAKNQYFQSETAIRPFKSIQSYNDKKESEKIDKKAIVNPSFEKILNFSSPKISKQVYEANPIEEKYQFEQASKHQINIAPKVQIIEPKIQFSGNQKLKSKSPAKFYEANNYYKIYEPISDFSSKFNSNTHQNNNFQQRNISQPHNRNAPPLQQVEQRLLQIIRICDS